MASPITVVLATMAVVVFAPAVVTLCILILRPADHPNLPALDPRHGFPVIPIDPPPDDGAA